MSFGGLVGRDTKTGVENKKRCEKRIYGLRGHHLRIGHNSR
jgi:hypothetical protein